jgi:hypothetical protein
MLIFVLFLIAIGILLLSDAGKGIIAFFLNIAITGTVFIAIGVFIAIIVYLIRNNISDILGYLGVFMVLAFISIGILKVGEKNGKTVSDIVGMKIDNK